MRQITLKKPVASVSSLGGSACVVFAATFACFMSAASLSAQGSTNVFNDAVFWFRGGKDLNGDGYMQQGEFFDDLHADVDSHDNHNLSMTSYAGQTAGYSHSVFEGNATIATEQVVFPALGTNVVRSMKVLHISNNATEINKNNFYFPFYVNPYSVFKDNNISNEYTIISRIRLDHDGYNYDTCFAKVGYDASSNKGMWFGFAKSYNPDYPGCMRVAAYRTPKSGGSNTGVYFDLPVPTNTWVDLAVMVGNGKLRVGVAVPVSLASHKNNPTIAFDQKDMWTDNCTLLSSEHYKLFCGDGQTAPATANNADKSSFSGSVQQLAIWGRALSDQEVMAAFGMPRPAIFRIGFDNGSSHEFGGKRSGSSQTIDGLGSWQNIANAMKVGDTWTVNFTALRDEAGLAQIFSLKSLPNSATATIEPILNNHSLGEMRIARNDRAFWPVPKYLITANGNTLVIERKSGGVGDFRMDAMELGGSFGVGGVNEAIDDGTVMPGLIKNGIPSAADPNPQHWFKGFYPDEGFSTLQFGVWVDPDVADRASFVFATSTLLESTAEANEKFAIYVNGISKSNLPPYTGWKNSKLSFDPGGLKGGWNNIGFKTSDTTCHWLFGYYRFEVTLDEGFSYPPFPGLSIVIR